MLNKICIMGRITKDIELRATQAGVSVCNFPIACDRPKYGEAKRTDFIDCVAWGKAAEFTAKYFSKGAMVVIDGRLQTDTYEDSNGAKRKITRVMVEGVHFAGFKKGTASQEPTEIEGFTAVDEDEELPF